MKPNRREFLKTLSALIAAGGVSFDLFAKKRDTSPPSETRKTPGVETPPLPVIALSRLTFGARPEDWHRFQKLAFLPKQQLNAFVEEQLHPNSIADKVCDAHLAEAKLSTLNKSLKQLWQDHVVAADPQKRKAADPKNTIPPESAAKKGMPVAVKMDDDALRKLPAREVEIAVWLRAVYSERQLNELLVDFWHNHFNIYAWDAPIASVFSHFDREVIRAHAFGNFREMLEAVAQHPAMLFYLDNFLNQSGNPNENYARELFELHTLGAENYLGTRDRNSVPGFSKGQPVGYVDGDVYEAARCFTGWRVDSGNNSNETGAFLYFEPWHDRFQKIVLGKPIREYQPPMKDGRDVLDRLATHPGTSQFIARKLCRRFVADTPSESLVQAAAKMFRQKQTAPDQIRAVLRVILTSDEFRTTWGEKIKRPFEATAGMLRATNANFFPTEAFLNNFQRSGQRLFAWRTPDGYPDTREKWASTGPMLERWRLSNSLFINKMDGVTIAWEQMPQALRKPTEIVNYWGDRIFGRAISESDAEHLVDFLSQGRNPDYQLTDEMLKERLPATVALLLMAPSHQFR